MTNQPTALRFDHREIAVIFSLFIFVSLLMFTVGIVVGKGLAQARFESAAAARAEMPTPPTPPAASLSLNLPSTTSPERLPAQAQAPVTGTAAAESTSPKPFKLIPKAPATTTPADTKTAKEAEALIHNPKIRALFETSPGTAKAARKAAPKEDEETDEEDERKTASVPPAGVAPPSFPTGAFTVQVGSYPTKTDAMDRINQLKEIGFAHAYLSVKKFGDGKEIWYRVWLGYYPDTETAKKSGEYLQLRGEVNNYLIRKSDNPG